MQKKLITLTLLLLSYSIVSAQIDSLINIPTIEVSAPRLKIYSTGQVNQNIDKKILAQYQDQNLSDLLSQQSHLFLKTYGQGSLATVSARGTGAGHTAVLWNGFNLQSPMNGVLDFALVPTVFMDEINILNGGSSALYGSGAIGATIDLQNRFEGSEKRKLQFGTTVGSYGLRANQFKITGQFKKIKAQLKLFNQWSENDFPFVNSTALGRPTVNQENAQLKQFGFLQNNQIQLSDKSILNTYVWFQSNERAIPPSITESNSNAVQFDEALRLATDLVHYFKAEHNLKIRAAYFDETILFNSNTVDAFNRSKQFTAEAENNITFGKNQVNVGIQQQIISAYADGYGRDFQQTKSALFIAWQRQAFDDHWKLAVKARQTLVDGQWIPFTASCGISGQLHQSLQIQASVSRNYKLPTFNDLFWADGGAQGNPDLRPESSFNQEAGFQFQPTIKQFKLTTKVTAFNSKVNDWILWAPAENGTWTPNNQRNVWNRGIELSNKFSKQFGNWKTNLNLQYSYVKATIESNASSTNLGTQLIYTPSHKGQYQLNIQRRNTAVYFLHSLTGQRFTSTDNLNVLPAFQLGQVGLSQIIVIKKMQLKLKLDIHNLWNTDYQVIAWRPMPPRHFRFSLRLNW